MSVAEPVRGTVDRRVARSPTYLVPEARTGRRPERVSRTVRQLPPNAPAASRPCRSARCRHGRSVAPTRVVAPNLNRTGSGHEPHGSTTYIRMRPVAGQARPRTGVTPGVGFPRRHPTRRQGRSRESPPHTPTARGAGSPPTGRPHGSTRVGSNRVAVPWCSLIASVFRRSATAARRPRTSPLK